MTDEPYDQARAGAWMHVDPATGQTVPVPPGEVFAKDAGAGPEILAQEPITALRRATGDRLAVAVGYMPKRDAVDFTNRRAAKMFGPPLDGVTAAQIYQGRGRGH